MKPRGRATRHREHADLRRSRASAPSRTKLRGGASCPFHCVCGRPFREFDELLSHQEAVHGAELGHEIANGGAAREAAIRAGVLAPRSEGRR